MPNESARKRSGRVEAIKGVPTSIAAFVGRTAKGPAGKAVRCRSYQDFLRKFGGAHPRSDLADSVKLFFTNGGRECHIVRISRRALRPSDFTLKDKGIYALDKAGIFNLLVLPGDRDIDESGYRSLCAAAGEYCRSKRAFLLIDAPESWSNKVDAATVETFRAAMVKSSAAVFYPRLEIDDAGTPKTIGASGAIAGLIARTDAQRGVWKAPAGIEADLRGVSDVEKTLTDNENGKLNKLGVNCIRKFPGDGTVNWGARTLEGADDLGSEWKYIPVRRLALFIEESVFRGTEEAVFEPNDEPLWVKIRLRIETFLTGLFRQGAFQGTTPKEAFFVRCGRDIMTQDDIDSGRLNIQIGMAPVKPAEFIIIYIQHMFKS